MVGKLVEYITPTWIPEEGDKCIPIYDSSIDGERTELVRCKDCKNNIGGRCDNLDLWVETDPEWFCADGRKKV